MSEPTADAPDAPFTVDLDNCEREPIHIPGSIQPHGLLLAFDPETEQMIQWSGNAPAVLGINAEQMGGRPMSEVLDAETCARLRETVRTGIAAMTVPLRTHFVGEPDGAARLGSAHLYQGILIVEYELEAADSIHLHTTVPGTTTSLAVQLRQATAHLQACRDMTSLYDAMAREIRGMNGFDRVMIYRFLEDGHGAVVGEAKADHLEPFLGLHYPATDIPPQARRLYTVNLIRLIADINAESVPIVPPRCPVHGGPLDLTYSAFRSVSPIHIEYLRNMGVAASMSISLLRGEELWGLVACHHYSPRILPFELRAGCELLGNVAASHLQTRLDAESVDERERRRVHARQALQIADAASTLWPGVTAASEELRRTLAAEGMALVLDDELFVAGTTPPAETVRKIARRALAAPIEQITATPCLSEFLGTDADAAPGGGLAFRIGPEGQFVVLVFRPDYTEEILWAGNPDKAVEPTDDGFRLSPRKSFATWKQVVSGRSRPWTELDHAMAQELRNGLLAVSARQLAHIERANLELSRLNSDLNAFCYSASHDLKEPLRVMQKALVRLDEAAGSAPAEDVRSRIAFLRQNVQRMDDLLEALLRLSRAGRRDLLTERVDVAQVAEEAAEMSLGDQLGRSVQLQILTSRKVTADYMCLRDVLCNLFSNASRYNIQPVRTIAVGESDGSHPSPPHPLKGPQTVLFVRDNGIGIAPSHWEAVFQIFRRLHPSDAYGGGTGAGLTIARKILERHGGMLWVSSEPGLGSTFYLSLPDGE
ncbi:ATP-binding protein [Planctomyces sp. SH-PL14]|uniref:ATP-binding protein n=1 Tax=Planctomyces sp. SH-PL14 TaxID=1632864 RepID=UPI00078C2E30|nr:ATP-binding protein [Planctomyces sp. SH-PL14]AMV17653.1 Phytochrome-like protein cph1 [Planctomyces sp. SH-PL14]